MIETNNLLVSVPATLTILAWRLVRLVVIWVVRFAVGVAAGLWSHRAVIGWAGLIVGAVVLVNLSWPLLVAMAGKAAIAGGGVAGYALIFHP